MIPCEEIIIPNAVVPGQDVYQGPSNIYLAFPMENNGNGGVHSTGAPTASNASGGDEAADEGLESSAVPGNVRSFSNIECKHLHLPF